MPDQTIDLLELDRLAAAGSTIGTSEKWVRKAAKLIFEWLKIGRSICLKLFYYCF